MRCVPSPRRSRRAAPRKRSAGPLNSMLAAAPAFCLGLALGAVAPFAAVLAPHAALLARAALRARRGRHEPLVGKLVLVTGGASGLGLAVSREYARRGADLILVGRREEELRRAADELAPLQQEAGAEEARVFTVAADLSTTAGCERAAAEALAAAGGRRIFHAVHNAGLGQATAEYTAQQAAALMGLNAAAPALLAGALRAERDVYIASPQALIPIPRRSVYAASKAAVEHFARCTQVDGAAVTVAYPGWIRTNLRANAIGAPGGPAAGDLNHPRARAPSAVARELVGAALAGEDTCCFSLKNRAGALLYPFLPGLVLRLVNREYAAK